MSNPLFVGDNPIPFEILLKQQYGLTLFEREVKEILSMDIGKDGYEFKDAHIKLGSKIHLKNFYYAEKLFQKGYFAIRFAYLLSDFIFNKIERPSKPVTILGYGLYSELLVSNTARFLNTMYKAEDKFNHCIIEDVEKLTILNLANLKQKVILVIPIGSTLTTQIKIYKKLRNLGKDYDTPELLLSPICVIVIGHNEISDYGDSLVKNFGKE